MKRLPGYSGLAPKSERASAAARGASRKVDTGPELLLRIALWKAGLRYRKNRKDLPGVPDIVFPGSLVVVFVDGDFWHGKNWKLLKEKLKRGHNGKYWTKKIEANIERDREQNRQLRDMGWTVLRVWESEIHADTVKVVNRIQTTLAKCRSIKTAGIRNVESRS